MAGTAERRTVNFFSVATRIEGTLFIPSGLKPGERRPAIVLCGGFTGVRITLNDYAKPFAQAGFVALTFDYRGWGGSDGQKWRLLPLEQVEDIRSAISFLEIQPEADPDRIGIWGTSFGGAHAPYVAGIDRRVKAAVGQVGFGDGERFILDTRNHAERLELMRKIAEDRKARILTGEGERIGPIELALRSSQSREFIPQVMSKFAGMRCQLSWETAETTLQYKPIDVVKRIAPRALMLIGARDDDCCPLEGYQKLYERAGEPRKLAVLPITHYEIYSGKWLNESARLATEWFERFL